MSDDVESSLAKLEEMDEAIETAAEELREDAKLSPRTADDLDYLNRWRERKKEKVEEAMAALERYTFLMRHHRRIQTK